MNSQRHKAHDLFLASLENFLQEGNSRLLYRNQSELTLTSLYFFTTIILEQSFKYQKRGVNDAYFGVSAVFKVKKGTRFTRAPLDAGQRT